MKFLKSKSLISSFIVMIALAIVSITSCTNDEPQQVNVSEQEANGVENLEVTKFLQSVDSLNASYCSMVTRSSDNDDGYVTLADAVGGVIGSEIGRRIGGNRNSWWSYGSSLFSSIAEILLANEHVIGVDKVVLFKEDFSVSSSRYDKEASDSIGYYHNVNMVDITRNRNKYTDGKIIFADKIYCDIVANCKKMGLYESAFDDPSVKSEVLHRIDDICNLTLRCAKGVITKKELIDKQTELLMREYDFDGSDVELYKDFVAQEAFYCATLNEDILRKYAADLDDVIEKSEFSRESKADISSTVQIIINSTLCWQQ